MSNADYTPGREPRSVAAMNCWSGVSLGQSELLEWCVSLVNCWSGVSHWVRVNCWSGVSLVNFWSGVSLVDVDCCDGCRRRTETANEDEDDVEFAPRKAIKLEDAANPAGNLCCFVLGISAVVSHMPTLMNLRRCTHCVRCQVCETCCCS